MHKVIAIKLVGGLGDVSKMPGKSYGLPTASCVTGSKLAEVPGTICHNCYAKKGFYRTFACAVVPAQERRLASLDDPQWVEAMIVCLKKERWFRWNDSGDVQSVEHLDKIMQVADETPWCNHWLATRERTMLEEWLSENDLPYNMNVRLSATWFDQPVRLSALLDSKGVCSSNVHSQKEPVGYECQAPKQFGKCETCRACWDRNVKAVSYKEH